MATSRTSSIKTNYRLSPNEEAALIKEEKAKRRKLRIQQVQRKCIYFLPFFPADFLLGWRAASESARCYDIIIGRQYDDCHDDKRTYVSVQRCS